MYSSRNSLEACFLSSLSSLLKSFGAVSNGGGTENWCMARAITTSERLIPPTSLIDLNMTRIPVSGLEPPSRVQEGTLEITPNGLRQGRRFCRLL